MTIDTDTESITVHNGQGEQIHSLYSKEGFDLLSKEWLKVGWNQKHLYTFSWLGRPIIQLPDDILRMQEVIYRLKPDVIIECGVAHGGSLILYASLCRLMGRGRVIGVDIEIRPHNRQAIEQHELASLITLFEGDSTSPDIVNEVAGSIRPGESVLVILDSDHSKQHVTRELEAYHRFVTPGSYIVATDGIIRDVHDAPRGRPEWSESNPAAAAEEFVKTHPSFRIEPPTRCFDEGLINGDITHWPSAWLRRLEEAE